jgi:RNA polymerase sigma-70 factor (ECF subfamily)
MVPASANGQPAFALYMKQPDGSHRAFQLQVLTLTSKGVSHVSTFFDTTLFEQFGLSEVLVRGASTPATLTSDA